jgi:phage terminase large subunit-like protein
VIAPAYALPHIAPKFFDLLTPAEQLTFVYDFERWLRPDQRVPRTDFRSFGVVAGRGFGKSFALATEVNRRVEAGEARSIALMAPNLERVSKVQAAFLVATSPPWFRAEEVGNDVHWPNGVIAEAYTPFAPGRTRSGNFDLSWATELVDWQESTRLEAFKNLATATRVGAAQILWDTTSKGKNALIKMLVDESKRDPDAHILRRGLMFDNLLLTKKYLIDTCSKYVPGTQRYAEEVEGAVFNEAAGSLWTQDALDKHRVPCHPPLDIQLVSLDPALSDHDDADETGIAVGGRSIGRQGYLTEDLSGKMTPEQWASIVVDKCVDGPCSGVIVERNHLGDTPRDLIKVHAERRGWRINVLEKLKNKENEPFPRRQHGVINIREIVSRESKGDRASAPASLCLAGSMHLAGTFAQLELELTTWVPGQSKSPNRLDAFAQLTSELFELANEVPKEAAAQALAGAAMLQQALADALGGSRRIRF